MKRPKLSTVDVKDYPRLASFLSTFPGEKRAAEFWRNRLNFWWDENPSFSEEIPRGWLLENEGLIEGFLGNIPSRMKSGGTEFTALGMSTWRVLPQARTHSLDLLYAMAIAGETTLTVNTTANEDVRKVLRSLRFEEWKSYREERASFLPANGSLLSRISSLVLNIPFALAKPAPPGTVELNSSYPGLDDHLNRFWARSRNRALLATVRDARFFRWFCFADIFQKKFLLGHFENGELRASAIFCRRVWSRKTELAMLDFWTDAAPADDCHFAIPLIQAGRKIADREGCDLVRYPHFTDGFAAALPKCGVWIQKTDGQRHFFHGKYASDADGYLSGIEGDFAL